MLTVNLTVLISGMPIPVDAKISTSANHKMAPPLHALQALIASTAHQVSLALAKMVTLTFPQLWTDLNVSGVDTQKALSIFQAFLVPPLMPVMHFSSFPPMMVVSTKTSMLQRLPCREWTTSDHSNVKNFLASHMVSSSQDLCTFVTMQTPV